MEVYFPVAELSLNLWIPLLLGAGVGVLTGLFGVGGGFLLTPVLIFLGVPPPVAVASGAAKFVGSSVSGALAHWRRGNIDIRMGIVLLIGGTVGSFIGVRVFSWLRSAGQVDIAIAVLYVSVLFIVGGVMFVESLQALRPRLRNTKSAPPKQRAWIKALPFPMAFPRSQITISPILPFLLGMVVGFLSAMMGVGGGFIMVPVMIYVIGMPTRVVIGTSLFQIIFVTAGTALMQAVTNHTVDVLLVVLLLIGGVTGAQVGTWLSDKLRAEQLRLFLALLVLGVGVRMAMTLFLPPDFVFSIGGVGP